MSHWLEDAVMEGLTLLDVSDVLHAQVEHFSVEGEWRKGVISPSLLSNPCPLRKVKQFLGHTPTPGVVPKMALKAGKSDPVSLVNMVRGFDGEGLIIAALKRRLPVEILASAPQFTVEYNDPGTGMEFAGHPDVMYLGNNDDLKGMGLIQIKTPSVFKLDRVLKKGDDDALETYGIQMITEMFITRKSGIPVTANTLLLFSWEGTVKQSKPRLKAITMPWEDAMEATVMEMAYQVYTDASNALINNVWPQAYPNTSWDVWPCGYCPFARLGDFEVPACDDHAKWKGV